ncbi:hypothetical protein VNO80_02419 [Phaseolus coccineus]|uniref:Uncharacterized protein n=1 Tax=Phaseolus coccineus TaxID=3886 RepID=A0AAN9RMD0_PHACN
MLKFSASLSRECIIDVEGFVFDPVSEFPIKPTTQQGQTSLLAFSTGKACKGVHCVVRRVRQYGDDRILEK